MKRSECQLDDKPVRVCMCVDAPGMRQSEEEK